MNSPLERISLTIVEMQSVFSGSSSFDHSIDHREEWREAVGLADIVAKSLYREKHASFRGFCPHLALLCDPHTRIAQNVRSKSTDQASNKLFELLMGLAAMKDGLDVELEDPNHATDGNPDVLVTLFGRAWGLACKVPNPPSSSPNPKTYADNVRAAVQQIESSRAEKGLVVMNLKNVLNHDALWPANEDPSGAWMYYPAQSLKVAEEALQKETSRLEEDVFRELGGETGVTSLFSNKKAVPLIVNYSSTVLGVIRSKKPVVTSLRTLTVWQLLGRIDNASERVADSLSRGLQEP